jgi:polyferredoxin
MDHMGCPGGLIRYTSISRLKQARPKWLFRRRLLFPALILCLVCGLAIFKACTIEPFNLFVQRNIHPDDISSHETDIRSNYYHLVVTNKTSLEQGYRLSVEGLPGSVHWQGPQHLLVGPGEQQDIQVALQLPPGLRIPSLVAISFVLSQDRGSALDKRIEVRESSHFINQP